LGGFGDDDEPDLDIGRQPIIEPLKSRFTPNIAARVVVGEAASTVSALYIKEY
jgi:hypothetical protein